MKNSPSIPAEALRRHIAILGMNGSGKTSVAKSQVIEPALEAGERVCNIDPTGVGWGLRLSATGKSKGFSIYIVGGEHADFPLFRRDGHAWGEIVGTTSDSFVFDTSQMTVSDRSLWFTDFAETLLRRNKGPLKLVIDEAHLFAPQGGAKGGGATPDMLHATNNLLALGRSRGLRITMISQRPAKLHKDSLTQAHTLIAMSLMAPHDREAVSDWIADQADAARGKEIVASLPTLDPGEGWIWAPREKVLERVRFARPRTFDSSSAPDDGDTEGPSLPAIDPGAIKAKLETVAKETVANDPRTLRVEIAKLKAELAKKPAAEKVVDTAAIDAAQQQGYQDGYRTGRMHALGTYGSQLEQLREAGQRIGEAVAAFNKGVEEGFAKFKAAQETPDAAITHRRQPYAPSPASHTAAAIRPSTSPTGASRRPGSTPGGGGAVAEGISRPQQKILDALRWLESVGIERSDRTRAAMLANVSSKSSGFEKNVSTLSTKGLIRYPGPGELQLTEDGRAIANAPSIPPTSADLQAAIRSKISGPQWTLLEQLIPLYPEALSREELARAANVSHLSSGFEKNVSTLSGFGFVSYPERGAVAATKLLFVEG